MARALTRPPVRDGAAPRVLAWLAPVVPLARLAWVRAILAVTAVVDTTVFIGSVRHRADSAELYQPVALARLLHLPPPSTVLVWLLTVLIWAGAVAVVAGGLRRIPAWVQRVGGVALSVGYCWWMVWAMSFGYVAHDHMAIFVAMLVLPTGGVARYADVPDVALSTSGGGSTRPAALTRSAAAGWALRMIQLFTVLTYAGSVLAKAVLSGWDLTRWANSATLAWAFLRRPSPLNELLVDQVVLLRLAQWGALVLELAAPLVFLVRERWRWLVAAAYLGFHLSTLVLLGIHFLPTVVCWSAFLPWERWLTGRVRPLRARRAAS